MINELESVRIDKWLWAVRIYKTRSVASDACERGRVRIDGSAAKPSRKLKPGQTVTLRRRGIEYQFKVLKCIDKRVGAPVAAECKEDITPAEELNRLSAVRRGGVPKREAGAGRPTKRDRRKIDELYGRE